MKPTESNDGVKRFTVQEKFRVSAYKMAFCWAIEAQAMDEKMENGMESEADLLDSASRVPLKTVIRAVRANIRQSGAHTMNYVEPYYKWGEGSEGSRVSLQTIKKVAEIFERRFFESGR